MSREKQIWEGLAEKDAYFAVSTYDEFRGSNIDDAAKEKFFASGREHVEMMWHEFEEKLGAIPKPMRALDYGCGVGRILIPLAERSEQVTGVDISPKMLVEAGENLSTAGCGAFRLITDEEFDADVATYDFVHTFIVIQHIKPELGLSVIRKMIDRLAKGGCGMIHFTHTDPSPFFQRMRSSLYRDVPGAFGVRNVLRGTSERHMPMHLYSREKVYEIMDTLGCTRLSTSQTDHGFLGEMVFFRKGDG